MHGGEEFAHQHVEAAVAAKRDDLTGAIERLDAVGLAERRSDRGVVERTDDPLRSALAYPVSRPQRVEPGIQDEDRIACGKIADRPRHGLRVNAVLAARRIGLLAQHVVPLLALRGDAVPEFDVALFSDPIEQQFQRRAHRADHAERGRCAAAENARPIVHLDDGAFAREEFRIRIVGAEHQKEIAMHDRVVDGFGADHADAPHPVRVIERHDVLALDRMNERRLEPVGERAEFFGGTMTAIAAHDCDAAGFVDAAGDIGDLFRARNDFGPWLQSCNARHRAVGLCFKNVLRDRQVGDAASSIGRRNRLMNDGRRLSRREDGFGIERDIAE